MGHWSKRVSEWAIDKSRWLLGALVIITVFFAFQAMSLQINPSLFLIGKDYEGRIQLDRARTHFTGNGEQIILGVVTQKESIINTESLKAIDALTHKLGATTLIDDSDATQLKALARDDKSRAMIASIIEGGINVSDENTLKALIEYADKGRLVKGKELDYLKGLLVRISPIRKVRSLTTAEDIRLDGDSLQVHGLMDTIPEDAEGLKTLREEIEKNALLKNAMLSHDGKGTIIQVELTIDEEDSRNLQKMYDKALEIIATVDTKDSIHLGGTATYYAAITEVVEKDNNKFFPVVMIVISLSLFFGMRSWQGVWMPILVAITSVIWTMGTVTLLGYKLNLITNMIPVFLLSLATSDSIHFLSRYYLFTEKMEKVAAIKMALSQQLMPMFLSSLCTFFGFIALAYTKLTPVFQFGVFVACGVIYAFIITICLIPGLVPYLKLPSNIHAKRKDARLVKVIDRVCAGFDAASVKNPRTLMAILALVMIGLTYFAMKIKVDNENMASFSKSARVRQDNDVLNQRFSGTVPIYVWLEGEQNDDMKKPEVITAMRLIQARLKSHKEIGFAVSPADFLDKIHSLFAGDSNVKLPADAASNVIAQYFLLYEFGEGSELKDILDFSYRNARVFALGYTDQGSVWQGIVDDISQYSKTVLPANIKAHIVGNGEQQAACIREIVDDQINSFMLSSGLIFIVMILLMRSIPLGLIAMIPIFVSVLLVGCFMVVAQIELDIGTSMICGICLGVGIDYAIYYSTIFKQYMAETKGEYESALKQTMSRVAYPIVVNGLSLGMGFAVLCLSGYAVISNLGLLVALSQLFSILCTLSLLPMLIRAVKPKL